MPKAFALLGAVFVWIAALATAGLADDYTGPAPDWVISAPSNEPRGDRLAQASGGLYYLTSDRQVKWQPEQQVSFKRLVYKIIDRAGLEAGAQILESFDPTHESVKFHKIVVHRDRAALDQLGNVKIEVYRREQDLDKGIVDGHLTAHANIPDVRIGDVIEYEISTTSRPELDLDHFQGGFYTRWTVPVAYTRYRVLLPSQKRLYTRSFSTGAEVRENVANGITAYEWVIEDPEPLSDEQEVPAWEIRSAVLLLTMNSWRDVSKLLAPHYRPGKELPADFRTRLDAIARSHPDTLDRITEVLRLVQDSIRYVGNEVGPGAYIPRMPDFVLRNGYGDCKDKTVLLIEALRHLEITATPALVHLTEGHGVADRLPSLGAFDHVIVHVKDGGRGFWLDPTLSHQGGRLPNLLPPDYGYALPISEAGTDLVKISQPAVHAPELSMKETIAFPPDDEGSVEFQVVSEYTGTQANSLRWQLNDTPRRQLEKSYFDYYAQLYPGLKQAADLLVIDDREKNRISISEFYRLDNAELAANLLGTRFPLKATALSQILKTVTASGRTRPLRLAYPLNRRHQINIFGLKQNYKTPKDINLDNEQFRFDMTGNEFERSIQITWNLQTKQRTVTAKNIPDYLVQTRKINDSLYWEYNFTAPGEPSLLDDEYLGMTFVLFLLGRLAGLM